MSDHSLGNISLVLSTSSGHRPGQTRTNTGKQMHITSKPKTPEPYTTIVEVLTTTDASLGPITIYRTIIATPTSPFASTIRGSLATSQSSDNQPSHSSKVAVAVSVPVSVVGIVAVIALTLVFLRRRSLRKQRLLGRSFDLPSDVEIHDYIYPEVKPYSPPAPNTVYRSSK